MVAKALGKLELCYLSLVYQPLCCGSFVIYLYDQELSFFDEERFVPAFVADASNEHSALSFSVVESPISYRLHLVEISTVSLVDSALIDQPDAYCVLSTVLDNSNFANGLFSIDVYGLFADDLMEVAVVLDLLHS